MVKVLVVEVAVEAGFPIGFARGMADDGTVRVTVAGPAEVMESLGWAMVAQGEPIAIDTDDFIVIRVEGKPLTEG